jgi:hypothetical protein
LFFVTLLILASSAGAKDEKCHHATDYYKNIEKCLPIVTEKSTLGDLTLHITGTEVEMNLQQTKGKIYIKILLIIYYIF